MLGNIQHQIRVTCNEIQWLQEFQRKYAHVQRLERNKGIIRLPKDRKQYNHERAMARSTGRPVGRPPSWGKLHAAAVLLGEGKYTYAQIAARVPCSSATVWRTNQLLLKGQLKMAEA